MKRAIALLPALALAGAAHAHNTNHFVLVGLDDANSFSPPVAVIEVGDTVQWNFVTGGRNVVAGEPGAPTGAFQSVTNPAAANGAGATFTVTFDEAFLAQHPTENNMYSYFADGIPGMTAMVRVLTEADKNPPSWRNVDRSTYAAWEFETAPTAGTAPHPIMEVGSPPLPHASPTELHAIDGAQWTHHMLGHHGVLTMGPTDSVTFLVEFWPDAGVRTGRVQYTHTGATSNHQINLYIDGQPTPVTASVDTTWWPSGWYHTTLEFLAPGPSSGPFDGRWELILTGMDVDGVVIDYAMGELSPTKANEPKPASGAAGINANPILSWKPGVGAVSHELYLGTSPNLGPGDLVTTTTDTTHTAGPLNDGQTYYWRVDELDGTQTIPGDVWSFTVTQSSLGLWTSPTNVGVMAGHQVLMPNGRVLIWEYASEFGAPVAKSYDFDPANLLGGVVRNAPHDAFCSGMTMLPDGRVIATGTIEAEELIGLYDMTLRVWTAGSSMQRQRYYPSTIIMGDGSLLTFGGLSPEDHELTIERAPADASSWTLQGGQNMPEQGEEGYPRLHLLSDGRIFMSGQAPRSYIYDPVAKTWTQVATTNHPLWRAEAPSVRLLDGRILIFGGWDLTQFGGGTLQETATAEIIDPEAANPAWQSVQSLAQPRQLHDGVLLPNGEVLCIGGETGGENFILSPEIFDPSTETWRTVAAHQDIRGYHATAGLLPDGRVLCGGTDEITSVEIYSPPYLFLGDRPVVTSSPATGGYGQTIQVDYTSTDPVTSVVLMRPGCITHSFNYNQIGVPASFTDFGSYLRVDIPSNPNVVPPGHYLLFLVSSQGVPSVAPFIQLGPPTDCPGDTDGSGAVDIDDVINVVLDFGTDGSANGGDANGSGFVDIDDVVFVILNFGACPGA